MIKWNRFLARFISELTNEEWLLITGSFEWPNRIPGWDIMQKEIMQLAKLLRLKWLVEFDGCRLGWEFEATKVKKAMKLLVGIVTFRIMVHDIHYDNSHEHIAVAGRVTKTTQNYPTRFCKLLIWSLDTLFLGKFLDNRPGSRCVVRPRTDEGGFERVHGFMGRVAGEVTFRVRFETVVRVV